MSFSDLGLSPETLKAVAELGYNDPTPIQQQAIPQVLMGRDVLGIAQTGTGKTAGFTLPMIDILANGRAKARMPRSLILAPTRELANQVAENFTKYGKYHKLTMALLIGGESFSEQEKALDRGVDVLIATPGRLMDLFGRGRILLRDVKILVIDEADRMLDMGFIPDVEKIVSLLPPLRQTLFFSATMDKQIRRLADAFLQNPKEVRVDPGESTAATVTQMMTVVADHDKREALRHILHIEQVKNAFIFCNRKRDVSVLHRSLQKHGFDVVQLHGDMPQSERTATLARFKAGDVSLMVCSDVAARGIDIADVSHVFNFDVPSHSEDYVHRIGRTGRAGREGRAYTIATPEDIKYLSAIESLIGNAITRIELEGIATLEMSEEAAKEARRGRRSAPSSDRTDRSGGRDRGGRSRSGRTTRVENTPVTAPVEATVEDTVIVPEVQDVPAPVVSDTAPAETAVPDVAATEAPQNTASERPRNDRSRDRTRRNERQGNDTQTTERSSSRDRSRGRRDHPAWDVPEMDHGDNVLAFGGHTPAFLLVKTVNPIASTSDDDDYDDEDKVETQDIAPLETAATAVTTDTENADASGDEKPARTKRPRRRRSRGSSASVADADASDIAPQDDSGSEDATPLAVVDVVPVMTVEDVSPIIEAAQDSPAEAMAEEAPAKPKRTTRTRRKPAAKTEAAVDAPADTAPVEAAAPADTAQESAPSAVAAAEDAPVAEKPKRAPRARKAPARTTAKTAAETAPAGDAPTEDEAPAKPKRTRKAPAKPKAEAAAAGDTTETATAEKPKRAPRTRKAPAKAAASTTADADPAEDAAKPKRAPRVRKATAKTAATSDAAEKTGDE